MIGVDSNLNYIRDDVERYIEIVYDDSSLAPVLAALKKEAIKYQKQLEYWESKEMVLAVGEEGEMQEWCTLKLMSEHIGDHHNRASSFFQAQIFNTYERLQAWNRINAYHSGMTFTMPDDEILSSQCTSPPLKFYRVLPAVGRLADFIYF